MLITISFIDLILFYRFQQFLNKLQLQNARPQQYHYIMKNPTSDNYYQELRAEINEESAAMKNPNIQYTTLPQIHPYVQSIVTGLKPFQPTYKTNQPKSNPIKWKNSVYHGQLKNGIPDGEGVMIKPNGIYMHGSYKGGISMGKFRIVSPTMYVYEGNVLNDNPEGEGEYQSKMNFFKGKFTIGLPTGEGQETYNNGEWVFKGTYQMGIKKNGTLKWGKTGDNQYTNYYKGSLDKEGKYDGTGTLKTNEGTYSGEFKNGLKEGKGEFLFINGCRYEGTYKRNQKSGHGTFYNGNKSKWYEGEWHRDLPNGKGEFFTNNVSGGVTQVVYGIRKSELDQLK